MEQEPKPVPMRDPGSGTTRLGELCGMVVDGMGGAAVDGLAHGRSRVRTRLTSATAWRTDVTVRACRASRQLPARGSNRRGSMDPDGTRRPQY